MADQKTIAPKTPKTIAQKIESIHKSEGKYAILSGVDKCTGKSFNKIVDEIRAGNIKPHPTLGDMLYISGLRVGGYSDFLEDYLVSIQVLKKRIDDLFDGKTVLVNGVEWFIFSSTSDVKDILKPDNLALYEKFKKPSDIDDLTKMLKNGKMSYAETVKSNRTIKSLQDRWVGFEEKMAQDPELIVDLSRVSSPQGRGMVSIKKPDDARYIVLEQFPKIFCSINRPQTYIDVISELFPEADLPALVKDVNVQVAVKKALVAQELSTRLRAAKKAKVAKVAKVAKPKPKIAKIPKAKIPKAKIPMAKVEVKV